MVEMDKEGKGKRGRGRERKEEKGREGEITSRRSDDVLGDLKAVEVIDGINHCCHLQELRVI